MQSPLLLPYLYTMVACVVALIFFIYYGLIKKSRPTKQNMAPEPEGAWPIIGHLPLIAGPQLPHIILSAMADKYGPILTLRMGARPTLVVSSWELAKEIFINHDRAVASRPQLTSMKHLGYNCAAFGFAPYGPFWREMRKIVTFELLSNQRIELLKHVRISVAEKSLKEMYRVWTRRQDRLGDHVVLELKQWFEDWTLNVILRMIAGTSIGYGTGSSAVGDQKEERQWQKATGKLFYLLGMFVVRDAIPWLGWLDVGGHEKAMKKTAKELDSIVGQWLEEHKKNRKLANNNDAERDFIDILLHILDGKSLSGHDFHTIIKATVLSMVTGANGTTTVTLTWAISLLLNNRHVLRKVQEESDTVVGGERLVNDSDISKLVYLQAVVKETLRLYPPVPLSAPRQFIEDCTIGGTYHVSRGTMLLVNLWKIHRDNCAWADPLEFRPERFLTTHKDVDVRGQHFELIPFGSGRRACPGMSLGLQMVHLALATFLHAFEISASGNTPVDMTQGAGIPMVKANPLDVLVSPRLSPDLFNA